MSIAPVSQPASAGPIAAVYRRAADKGGAAAVEFAMLLPIMITLFFGVVETSQAQLFRFWGSRTATIQQPVAPPVANPLQRLEEIKVELAWLSDPALVPFGQAQKQSAAR